MLWKFFVNIVDTQSDSESIKTILKARRHLLDASYRTSAPGQCMPGKFASRPPDHPRRHYGSPGLFTGWIWRPGDHICAALSVDSIPLCLSSEKTNMSPGLCHSHVENDQQLGPGATKQCKDHKKHNAIMLSTNSSNNMKCCWTIRTLLWYTHCHFHEPIRICASMSTGKGAKYT